VSSEDETVRLRADRVPAGGAEFVMSRLDWPGYTFTNAERSTPTDGYLLTVQVPESSEGEVVELSYAPPHWDALRAGLLGSVGLAVLWSLAAAGLAFARRRRDRSRTVASLP
jgi:hypothetical protein